MTNTTTPPQDTAAPWLADDERGAWMTLIALLMSLPTAIDAQLKRDSGLNFFEYSILSSLSRRPGRAVRMNTLALFAGGSASRLSHAVSRLERQGWVRREVRNGEVRCTEAMLTEKGMAALEAAAPGHVREARRLVFDAITPEQVGQLRQITRQLLEAATPEMAAALDQAIVEAAAEASAGLGVAHEVGACSAAIDRAIVEAVAESPCTAALDEACVSAEDAADAHAGAAAGAEAG
ncbi:MarR family winged helix-turn-helix transcriptional regulator [Paractinoplanes globisporus]|uniref:MarR family winged helix-turn-helix transcriptional regulator n=1 Tax=Paractinoplanes globisporus TaxID=113565 RepID=A0ABW6WK58_9ACTN|nr:MarR family transcriptional regulator [Actinoplanes globisporus]